MNKSKIIIPLATALLTLTSCGGVKTKKVKEIWGNTWAYVNSSIVTYNINESERLRQDNINWEKTYISCNGGGYGNVKFEKGDQKIQNLIGSEFIRTSNYDIFKKNRDFFKKNKIVVSSKGDAKVKVGNTEYPDATEAEEAGYKEVLFNSNRDSLKCVAYDGEKYIDGGLEAEIGDYRNRFTYRVVCNDDEQDYIDIYAYLELSALA